MTITKSGELASFYTVNKAPIKHLRVYFSPKQAGSGDPSPENVREVEGWGGIEVTQCGKNLYDIINYPLIQGKWTTWNSITGGGNDNNFATVGDNNYIPSNLRQRYPCRHLAGLNITLNKRPGGANPGFNFIDKNTNYIEGTRAVYGNNNRGVGTPWTIPVPNEAVSMAFTTIANDQEIQFEIGDNSTSYEPYKGQTYSLDWSSSLGTIYGGYVDLISGLLTVTHQSKIFNGNGSENWAVQDWNNVKNFYILVPDATINQYTSLYCNRIPSSSKQYLQTGTCGISSTRNLNLAIGTLLNISTVEELRAWLLQNNIQIVYSLETPITHQLTPQQLETFLGRNNIWSNADRVEIEYDLAESNDILYRRRNILEKGYPHIVTPEASQLVTFNTDMVAPLKECKVYFEPKQDLHGYSKPWAGGAGKNLLKISADNKAGSSAFMSTITETETGFDIGDNEVDGGYWVQVKPNTTYTYSYTSTYNGSSMHGRIYALPEKTWSSNYSLLINKDFWPGSATFTTDENTNWIVAGVYAYGSGLNSSLTNMQLEEGSTATSYEPYENICPIEGFNNIELELRNKNLVGNIFTQTSLTASPSDGTRITGHTYYYKYTSVADYIKVIPEETYTCTFQYQPFSANGIVIYSEKNEDAVVQGIPFETVIKGSPYTLTIPENGHYLRMSTVNYSNDPQIMIEKGAAATDYIAPNYTSIPITFPSEAGTVYGGYVDLIKGEVVAEYVLMEKTWGEWTLRGTLTNTRYKYFDFIKPIYITGESNFFAKSNIAPYIWAWAEKDIPHFYVDNNSRVYLWLPIETDDSTIIQILGRLKEPIHYTLTPTQLKTLRGINNIWSTANGNIELKYYTH